MWATGQEIRSMSLMLEKEQSRRHTKRTDLSTDGLYSERRITFCDHLRIKCSAPLCDQYGYKLSCGYCYSRRHGIAVTPDGSQVYVANFDSGTISVISTATNTVTSTITMGAGRNPTDIAITPDGTYEYITDSKHDVVYVLKGSAGGPGDWAVAFTPDGSKVYVTSENSNNMSVIDSASQHATSIAVGVGTSGLAVTRDGRYVFPTSKSGVLKEIYTATEAVSTAASGLGEAVPVSVPPSQ
jgi:YVTN family beta-propeller protein